MLRPRTARVRVGRALSVGESREECRRSPRMALGEWVRGRLFGPWFAQFGGGSAAASLPRSSGGPLSDLRSAGGLTARAPRGRSPGRRRPGGLSCSRFRLEVSEDLLDHDRILDAGDDAHRPAAHRACLDVDAEGASFILHLLQWGCPCRWGRSLRRMRRVRREVGIATHRGHCRCGP